MWEHQACPGGRGPEEKDLRQYHSDAGALEVLLATMQLRTEAEAGAPHPIAPGWSRGVLAGLRTQACWLQEAERQQIRGLLTAACLPPDLKYWLWQAEGSAAQAGLQAPVSLPQCARAEVPEGPPCPHIPLGAGTPLQQVQWQQTPPEGPTSSPASVSLLLGWDLR